MPEIDLCTRSRFGLSFKKFQVNCLENLKERLHALQIKAIGIGYIDLFDDLYETKEQQPVECLTESDFAWLIAVDNNCLRFVLEDEKDYS